MCQKSCVMCHVSCVMCHVPWVNVKCHVSDVFYFYFEMLELVGGGSHGGVRGSRQGLLPPRRFLCLHQPPGNDLTWPLFPTYPSWSGESATAPAVGTSWHRLSSQSSERSWRPLTLDGSRWNVLYLISYQLRLIHSRSMIYEQAQRCQLKMSLLLI